MTQKIADNFFFDGRPPPFLLLLFIFEYVSIFTFTCDNNWAPQSDRINPNLIRRSEEKKNEFEKGKGTNAKQQQKKRSDSVNVSCLTGQGSTVDSQLLKTKEKKKIQRSLSLFPYVFLTQRVYACLHTHVTLKMMAGTVGQAGAESYAIYRSFFSQFFFILLLFLKFNRSQIAKKKKRKENTSTGVDTLKHSIWNRFNHDAWPPLWNCAPNVLSLIQQCCPLHLFLILFYK